VPRSAGFWRVGRNIICEFDPQAEWDSARDALWQTALEKASVIEQGPPRKSHRPGDLTEEGGTGPSEPAAAHVSLGGRQSGMLLFVSPNYFGEEFDSRDDCDARAGRDISRDYVRTFDNGSARIVMAQWSSGKYVSQWTEVITRIKDHPLTDPVVQSGGNLLPSK
jgi:hypothetical protein